jgi:hypothetical protein
MSNKAKEYELLRDYSPFCSHTDEHGTPRRGTTRPRSLCPDDIYFTGNTGQTVRLASWAIPAYIEAGWIQAVPPHGGLPDLTDEDHTRLKKFKAEWARVDKRGAELAEDETWLTVGPRGTAWNGEIPEINWRDSTILAAAKAFDGYRHVVKRIIKPSC